MGSFVPSPSKSVTGTIVLFQTCPLTLTDSPANISGTISQRIWLLGSSGSTGPHGGESKSAAFCIVMVQFIPSEDRNGARAPAAIPESPEGVPSHRSGYGLPRLASWYVMFAFTRDGAWKRALHAPKDDPVNWVESQK